MKKFLLLAAAAVIAVSVSGCSLTIGSNKKIDETVTGGIFKTDDLGATWQQLGLIPTIGADKLNLYSLDTSVLKVDPSDARAFYLGTFADGIFYSYDAGASWLVMRGLGQKAIVDIAVDPKDKCVIYAATVGRIFKTTDCGRAWEEIYADNVKTMIIYAVTVDHFNSQIVYAANARGDVMKSQDGGKSWRTLVNFGVEVKKLVMDPGNSRVLLALARGKGLFKTADGGASWEDLTPRLQLVKADKNYRDLTASPAAKGLYFLAVDYGMFKTANYGEDWTEIKLLTPVRRSYINAVAASPLNKQAIYYDTETTFYSSQDGGDTWTSRQLPTSRQGSSILVSPAKDGAIYLGTRR